MFSAAVYDGRRCGARAALSRRVLSGNLLVPQTLFRSLRSSVAALSDRRKNRTIENQSMTADALDFDADTAPLQLKIRKPGKQETVRTTVVDNSPALQRWDNRFEPKAKVPLGRKNLERRAPARESFPSEL